MKRERKIIVKFVEAEKPVDISKIVVAIANKIKSEGVNENERRTKVL